MTDQKRVLWLTPDKPDNISVGRQRIADHLEDRGFAVTLRGTTIRTVLRSLRERGMYDAIIGTTRAGAIAGVLLKHVHRRPLVVDHVDPIRQFEETHPQWLATVVRYLENLSFRASDHVLYVYEEERERVLQYGTTSTSTDLGVEYDRFSDPDPDAVERAAETVDALDLTENVAIYIGGLEPIYHIETLVEAILKLDEWSLLVLGDGTLSEFVHEVANDHETIVYLGTVPHELVPGYLHVADVGVAMVDDPHTLKVLEYGAAGLPVVQSVGRAEHRFGEHVVYADADPKRLAEAIERATDCVSADDFQSFIANYDWDAIADHYEESVSA